MLRTEDIRQGMTVFGSDGKAVGTVNSLSGQMLKIEDRDAAHFLDVGYIGSISRAQNRIDLLLSGMEVKARWSDEGDDLS